jgi:lipopolysaccharide export system protein LptA
MNSAMHRVPSVRTTILVLALGLFAAPALAAPQNAPPPAGAPPAQGGATLLPGAASREPINISADKLDYFDKEQKAIYTGNVVAVQGDTRLNASVLTIFFDRKPGATPGAPAAPSSATAGPGGANSGLRRMEGKGPIAITSKDQIGTGDALVYDKPQNKFMLIGNVALSQGENVTRGDQLTYDLSTGQAVVSSKGRVHTLIVPEDAKSGAPQPGAAKPPAVKPPAVKPAAAKPAAANPAAPKPAPAKAAP